MKILVGINTLTAIDNFVYSNHASFYYRLGKMLNEEDDVILFHPFRMAIDVMRNNACKLALENEADYIFFIDDDVQIPWDAFFRLHRHNKDIVAGVTFIRGYPFHPMIFNFEEGRESHYFDEYEDHIKDGLVECDAVGFSCCLIKTSILPKMSTPYVLTGSNHTEDVYFCMKAKQEIPDLKVYVDPTIQTAHKLSSEFIERSNRAAWKTYCETIGLNVHDDRRPRDRPKDYLQQNKILPADIESRLRGHES